MWSKFNKNYLIGMFRNFCIPFDNAATYLSGREAADGGLAGGFQYVLRTPAIPGIPHAVQALQKRWKKNEGIGNK